MVQMDPHCPSWCSAPLCCNGGFKAWSDGQENTSPPTSTCLFLLTSLPSTIGVEIKSTRVLILYNHLTLSFLILCSWPLRMSSGCPKSYRSFITLILFSTLVRQPFEVKDIKLITLNSILIVWGLHHSFESFVLYGGFHKATKVWH